MTGRQLLTYLTLLDQKELDKPITICHPIKYYTCSGNLETLNAHFPAQFDIKKNFISVKPIINKNYDEHSVTVVR